MTQAPHHKVIFDTDPGVDDAMALYFALAHPAIELIGITTTFGNVTVEQAAINALYLTAITGRQIPVTRGVATPRHMAPHAPPDFIHGGDGLGNLASRIPTFNQLDPRSSAQFIVDMARAMPGEITVVAVGPLGNLALALEMEPRLPRLLRDVIVMGGTITEPGNVSPVAEANVWNEPHAADQVFTAGWNLTMVGLDVTHQVRVTRAMVAQIAQHHQHAATDALLHAVEFYAKFYTGLYAHIAQKPGCFAHDVLAFIYLVEPDLFTLESGVVRVATDGLALGQTMLNRRDFINYPQTGWGQGLPVTQVCMQVDADRSVQLFQDVLLSDWLRAA
ncbi:MAG: nucleoside hydrolase [Rhodoferax sp.]|nr:nucleoside hydrolase [Rhodoferax sp.]